MQKVYLLDVKKQDGRNTYVNEDGKIRADDSWWNCFYKKPDTEGGFYYLLNDSFYFDYYDMNFDNDPITKVLLIINELWQLYDKHFDDDPDINEDQIDNFIKSNAVQDVFEILFSLMPDFPDPVLNTAKDITWVCERPYAFYNCFNNADYSSESYDPIVPVLIKHNISVEDWICNNRYYYGVCSSDRNDENNQFALMNKLGMINNKEVEIL